MFNVGDRVAFVVELGNGKLDNGIGTVLTARADSVEVLTGRNRRYYIVPNAQCVKL